MKNLGESKRLWRITVSGWFLFGSGASTGARPLDAPQGSPRRKRSEDCSGGTLSQP